MTCYNIHIIKYITYIVIVTKISVFIIQQCISQNLLTGTF